jgi:predicted nucleic acid-binding protein
MVHLKSLNLLMSEPFHNQHMHMESEAIITILRHIEYSDWVLLSSGIVNYEINNTSDIERKERLLSLVDLASEFISINDEIHDRAKKIQEFGIKTYDSLHIACAENGHADVFLTTDDRLIKAVKRNSNEIKIQVENPLLWLYKVV